MRPPETTGAINVNVSATGDSARATVTGTITTRLKDIYDTLGLSASQVRRAINDLDSRYRYDELAFAHMTKTLTPVSETAHVVSVEEEPLVLTSRTFRNRSSFPATYEAKLSHSDSNSVAVSWSRVEQTENNYQIGFDVKLSGSASMKFCNTFGASGEKTSTVTVTSGDGVTVDLLPGQEARASLKVTRRVITFRVKYRVKYDGNVLGTRPDHSIMPFPLSRVLDQCGRSDTDTVTENIRIKYYTDSEVVLSDY